MTGKSRKKKTMGELESKYNYKNLDEKEVNMGIVGRVGGQSFLYFGLHSDYVSERY